MEPVTEQRPVPDVVVYGYLRLPGTNPARRTALTSALRAFCDRHELLLAGVFTDTGEVGMKLPAFAGLLDAVLAGSSYGVVIPSLGHLGTHRSAGHRSAAITGAGRRLIVMHPALVTHQTQLAS
jgi:hypothetical protein